MNAAEYIAKNVKCPFCDETFTNVYDGFGHLNDKHPAGKQEYKSTNEQTKE